MQRIEISEFGKFRLNSYTPLCINKMGCIAIEKYDFPPYIDSSCRREPDFQNKYPSISAYRNLSLRFFALISYSVVLSNQFF